MTDLKPCPRPDCEATVDHFHGSDLDGEVGTCAGDTGCTHAAVPCATECYAPRIPEPKPLPDIKGVKPGDWVELSSGDAKIVGTVWSVADEGLWVGDRVRGTVVLIRHSDGDIRSGWTLTDYRAAEPLIPDWPIGCLVEVVTPMYGVAAGTRLRLIPPHDYKHLPNSTEDTDGYVWAEREGVRSSLCWPADHLRLVPEPDRPDWWQTRGAVVADAVGDLWTCYGNGGWSYGSEPTSYDTMLRQYGPLTLVSLPVDGAK